MADEEKNLEEKKSGFMDILARGAEGAVDGLARSYPILGGALQAAVNTDEYQAQQLQKQVATQKAKDYLAQSAYLNDQLQYEQEQRDEWRGRKGTRDVVDAATRKSAEADAMKSDEYMSARAQAARMSGYDATAEENRLRSDTARYERDLLDQQQFSERVNGKRDALSSELSNSPYFMNLSFDEQKAYLNSPDVQNMLDASVYLDDIQGVASGDKEAYGRLERSLARQGWDLVDGENGMKYLDMGNGTRIAATPENISKINEMVKASAFEELQARNEISLAATLGNPAQSNISKYAKALMPYNNNSAARSLKQVQSIYANASPEQKTWTFFNQALQDYNDLTLPMSARLAGLEKCLPGVAQLGYTVEGFDPKNPDISSVVLKKKGETSGISLAQFADMCKGNDTISAQLDDMVARNQLTFGKAALIEAVKNVKDTGKDVSEKETSSEESISPDEQRRNELLDKAADVFGAQFDYLDDDGREMAAEALDLFERAMQRMLKKRGIKISKDEKFTWGFEDLKDLNAEWDKLKDLNRFGGQLDDLPFPLQEEFDVARKERDAYKGRRKARNEAEAKEREKEFESKVLDSYRPYGMGR